MPVLRVEVGGVGEPSRRMLRQAIRDLQAADPVRPVTVAVPSNYSGLSLRRTLARPEGDDPGGLLNVRFLVLPRVAELLGAPVLAARGQRPLTRMIQGELIRRALETAPGAFEPVATHPSTEQRLVESFRELSELAPGDRAALAATGGLTADVVRLFDEVQRLVQGQYYDGSALAEAAAEAARSGHPALRDLGALILFAPGPLGHGDRSFVRALGTQGDVRVILGATGDASADAGVLEQWASEAPAAVSDSAAETSGVPIATHIVSAPDAEVEVRHAIRMIVAAMEAGVPPSRMAIVSRNHAPYATLATSLLTAAGIPWNGSNPQSLAQTIAGRTVLGLLALPGRQFRRSDVFAWMTGVPILAREHGGVVPAFRWDTLARNAGVVRGIEDWRLRLERYAAQLERDLASAGRDDEPAEWRQERLQQDIEELRAFRLFMAELFEQLAHPMTSGWDMHADWARTLLTRYLGSEASLVTRLPADADSEHEIEAYRAVSDTLESLSALQEIRPEVDLPTFQRVLQRELERPARRISRFGDGVFVGRVSDVVGTDFDHIFVVGMNEGTLPSKGSDDPLLPDEAWDGAAVDGTGGGRASPRQSPRSRRARARAEERRVYLSALAAAPHRTLLAPRADLRGSQGRLRSRWLLESASVLAGVRLTNETLDRTAAGWHTLIPSFDGMVAGSGPAISVTERDLRSLRTWRAAGQPVAGHPLAVAAPALATGWTAQQERRSARFTRWDGHTGPLPAALLDATGSREHSPTALERWANCPRQYFFASVLRIAERDDPQVELSISARDRGTLIHEVLDQFISERRVESPSTPWSADDRARLRAIAEEACDRIEAEGATGTPLMWRIDRARLLRDTEAFLDTDDEHRRTAGVVPVATELTIGGARPVIVPLADGRAVRLRGRVDRVDRAPDGNRTIVIDYKSGSPTRYRKLDQDPVQAGTLLQLPVYALGAQVAYPGSTVDSRYWFTRHDLEERERFPGYRVDEAIVERLRSALRWIMDGISGGVFIGAPGKSTNYGYEHCGLCPYDAVCSRDRAREFDLKHADPAVGPLIQLSPAGAADDADDEGIE